jgi:hypothetical protein
VTELRVIHGGTPTDEELAAVVAVSAVLTSRAQEVQNSRPPSLREPLTPWVTSGLVKGTRTKV